MNNKKIKLKSKIDWFITVVPFTLIVVLSGLFFVFPKKSNDILQKIRFFFGDTMGMYYLVIGLAFLIVSIYIGTSKYGDIVLGNKGEKPKYSFFAWGSMMFTCGLAADILFYSFSEWIMYAVELKAANRADIWEMVSVYPIFHWSFIPWSFYLVLAVAFGFLLHVRKKKRQRFSEACRPVLGRHTDGIIGRMIDLFAVFALMAGAATTFSVATPLLSEIIKNVFGIPVDRKILTIVILLITCSLYTYSALHGIRGINLLSKICIGCFFGFLLAVMLFGGKMRFILEEGLSSMGRILQNFLVLSTTTDPMRETSFPQNWTVYYWAYWIVWCVATPFFIGKISKGRTIRQVIFGGYVFGAGSTIVSFIVLGNYSLSMQLSGIKDFVGKYIANGDVYSIIIAEIKTLPCSIVFFALLLITMVLFYATSFDSIALTASGYSYYELGEEEKMSSGIKLLWCVLLIILPVALVFSESSMSNLQTVSIIAAFPLGIIMVMIVWGFLIDAKNYLTNKSDILDTKKT